MTANNQAVTITALTGREVLDSRGNPTVEAQVGLSNGTRFHAIVPSGASTGTYEALELRDKDPARYNGNGVLTAVSNIDKVIAPAVTGLSPIDQGAIDKLLIDLDGAPGKNNLGANAILAVSMAVAQAAASLVEGSSLWRHLSLSQESKVSLPVPMFNILNGGKHASNSTDIQEFMVLPVGAESFSQALRTGVEIYQSLKGLLRSAGHNLNVGDEGGFAPSLPSNKDAIQLVLQAIETAGYKPGEDVYLGLDVAASEIYDKATGKYVLEREGMSLTSGEMVDLYQEWTKEYPILSIEDGLDEDDWEGWQELCRRLRDTVQLVGDDLLVTNIQRIQRSVDEHASNAVLLNPTRSAL